MNYILQKESIKEKEINYQKIVQLSYDSLMVIVYDALHR